MSPSSPYQSHQEATAAKLTILILASIIYLNLLLAQCDKNVPQRLAKDSRQSLSLLAGPITTTTTGAPPGQSTEAPDFTEPVGNHTVALGRDAQLSCKISNLGNFRTAWLRVEDKGILTIHNNIITRNYRIGLSNNDDGRNFVLTIKNVQPSDKGGYMCQINSVPMKYAIGYLDVLTPPVFDTDQSPQPVAGQEQPPPTSTSGVVTIAEGGNVSLTCRASGHPTPLITWRREDNEPILLEGAASEGVAKSEGPSISLASVSRLSSGAYLCIASNSVQPSASKRQLLDVQFSPVVRLPQTEVGVQLGQAQARLTCHIELNPLGSYHWVKLAEPSGRQQGSSDDDLTLIEHDELTNSDKFEIVIKQVSQERVQMTLAIRQVEKQDLAWYKCIARNSLGTQSNSIRLYESSSSTSSFSLNNMFRGSSSGSAEPPQQDQQHNDQQDMGGGGGGAGSRAKPGLSRTHTRSSWLQRSSAGRSQDQAANALQDSQAGSSAGGSSWPRHLLAAAPLPPLLLSLSLLLLSNYHLLASVAQIVIVAEGHSPLTHR